MNTSKKDPQFKVLMIGDSGVGKTCLIMSAVGMEFNLNMPTTISASEFKPKKMKVSDRDIVMKLQDTAGQQRYRSIANSYYKGSHGAFLVFDLTQQTTFKNIKHWVRQVKSLAGQQVYKILLGNKADLEGQRKVSNLQIQNFCTESGIKYYEVSALSRQNVDEALQHMGVQLLKSHEAQEPVEEPKQDKLELSSAKVLQTPTKKKCC